MSTCAPVRRGNFPSTVPSTGADRWSPAEEQSLILRLQAGENAAFEELVRRFGPRLLTVARRYFPCEHDAADALQDAFVSAFQAIRHFAGKSQLSTWLQRIVINACLMKLRARSRRPAVSIDELLPSFDDTGHHAAPVSAWSPRPLDELLDDELRSHVRRAIDQLPEIFRTVLVLRDLDGLDTDAAARELHVTPATIKTRLHRARQALRTLLEPALTL